MDEEAADFFASLENENVEEEPVAQLDDDEEDAADFFATLDSGHEASQEVVRNDQQYLTEAKPVLQKNTKTATKKGKIDIKKEKIPEATKKVFSVIKSESEELEEDNAPTDERIVSLLVPDMSVTEINQLIKKMKQAGKSESDEFSEMDSKQKTAPRFICDTCGNIDQNNFVTDYARGDTICMGLDGSGCGTVVQDHIVHEGNAYRTFEGEEDKSHHGPAPNMLFSSGHNLRTVISQEGDLSGNLRRAAEFVELNLSQMGKDERRTRIGYKDQMKRKAISMIDHVAANLDLHELVVARAKTMFAEFRDLREHVHQFEAVVAGCILAAYNEISDEMIQKQEKLKNRMAKLTKNAEPKAADEKTLHPFQCIGCGMKFNAKRGMQFHKCEIKSESTNNSTENMKKELIPIEVDESIQPNEEVRNGKKWFKCPVCSRSYSKLADVREHMERHASQSKKREEHIATQSIDPTRLKKSKTLVSANPSVQVNKHDEVLFRGTGRRPWLQHLQQQDNDRSSVPTST